MKAENKRIFISDIPEKATESEIQSLFGEYGKVLSIEVKQRKELGPKNQSLRFGYVNLEADDRSLQKCFNDFSTTDWHGLYVNLQLAKESFLERLKRERAEAQSKTVTNNETTEGTCKTVNLELKVNKNKERVSNSLPKAESADINGQRGSLKEVDEPKRKTSRTSAHLESNSTGSATGNSYGDNGFTDVNEDMQDSDIIIKDNRYKTYDKNKIKIESIGNEPIAIIDLKPKKEKKVATSSVSDIKRSESLKEKIKNYSERKQQIRAALSNVDSQSNKKIIFSDDDDDDDNIKKHNAHVSQKTPEKIKQSLFGASEDEDDEYKLNFDKQIGPNGIELLKMQSRFNDSRFVMNEHFIDDEGNENNKGTGDHQSDCPEEDPIQEEKKKELEILSQMFGNKIVSRPVNHSKDGTFKRMIRYDPDNENSAKLELKLEQPVSKKKKKKFDEPIYSEKRQEEKEEPVVSKEVFYKVADNLKETLEKPKEGFSLLKMFGRTDYAEEKDEDNREEPEATEKLFKSKYSSENPFKYDSSDDEDQTDQIPSSENMGQVKNVTEKTQNRRNNLGNRFETEILSLKEDDYRFQDGLDFIKRIATTERSDFMKVRKELKSIAKSKVKNIQRKNKPFNKKLGGNRKKKMLRMNKALKR